MLEQGQYLEGRAVLSALLFSKTERLSLREQQQVREALMGVNRMAIFSPERLSSDPLTETYTIKSGDNYSKIANDTRNQVPHQFLELINQVPATRLIPGKKLKLVKGPFHARVIKSQYLMDVYLNGPDGSPTYITTFPVGLGEDDSTPVGKWVVTPGSKTFNPSWRNAHTGEYFAPDDPKNPVGKYWIALSGVDANTANKQSYGIHGTIDPDSIGKQRSMGCIRLRNEDVALVFKMLEGGESTVLVMP